VGGTARTFPRQCGRDPRIASNWGPAIIPPSYARDQLFEQATLDQPFAEVEPISIFRTDLEGWRVSRWSEQLAEIVVKLVGQPCACRKTPNIAHFGRQSLPSRLKLWCSWHCCRMKSRSIIGEIKQDEVARKNNRRHDLRVIETHSSIKEDDCVPNLIGPAAEKPESRDKKGQPPNDNTQHQNVYGRPTSFNQNHNYRD
jgi:hypothetical protein